MKHRILFVAENITLAQVVRLAVLARSLDRERYEVHFASSHFDPLVFAELDVEQHPLQTLDKARVEHCLARGKRIYEKKTLLDYVRADLELIGRVRPALIIGDFRLSLGISAPVSGVPHAALINAYFSPYRRDARVPVPDHPIVELLGEELTERYFPRAIPKVFAHFAEPINAVRRHYGLPSIGSLEQVLTFGDYTLYPDVPELVPVQNAPASHLYIGPVLWSPQVDFDERWLESPDRDRALVYATLGSSGNVAVLPAVLEALSRLPVRVILATAGRVEPNQLPANVTARPFVPGERLARAASVVISNGGSTTGYQALASGTPVVGIASNLDQYLAMQAIERVGAGVCVKARRASAAAVLEAVNQVLNNPAYERSARGIANNFANYPAGELFPTFVRRAVDHASTSNTSPLTVSSPRKTAVERKAGAFK
ncbi:MAG TPA: glycosyltransferase [Polyangiaceae bacterium]